MSVAAFEALQNNGGARPVHIETALQRVVMLYESWGRPELARTFAEQQNSQTF
jgi:hypothetical protein